MVIVARLKGHVHARGQGTTARTLVRKTKALCVRFSLELNFNAATLRHSL